MLINRSISDRHGRIADYGWQWFCLLSILLGLVVAVSLSFILSLPYTPMHAILLCIGIGIAVMLVIMQCLINIK